MRRIKWIALGVPLAVCLCGLFAGPAPHQDCASYDGMPDCDTYNVVTGEPCKVQADCLDMESEPCGFQRGSASVSLPKGATCEAGTGYNRECGSQCGGEAWAEAWKKNVKLAEATQYCCNGCY